MPVIPFHLHLLGFLSPLSIAPLPSSSYFPALTMPTLEGLFSCLHSDFASELLHEIPGQPSSPLP